MNQHDIVTQDGIEILIKEVDAEHARFTATSANPEFVKIFGKKTIDIHDDGENLVDFVNAKVKKGNQEQAFKIIEEILSAI